MKTQSDPCDPDRLRLLADDRLPPDRADRSSRNTSSSAPGAARRWIGWSRDGSLARGPHATSAPI